MIYYNRLKKEHLPSITFPFNIIAGTDVTNANIGNLDPNNFAKHVISSEVDSFNQPVGGWNMSKVNKVTYLFAGLYEFNQPIGDWDMRNITSTYELFDGAMKFNQPVGDWDISNVTNISYMFCNARRFNQDISNWDVSTMSRYNTFYRCPIEDNYKPKGVI